MKTLFVTPDQLKDFNEGKMVVASNERFFDDDLPIEVGEENIGDITHGGTLYRIKLGGFKK